LIYFMQPTEGGPVKIGTSIHVSVRHKQLEDYYGKPLAILATMEGGRREEAAIHGRFAHLRIVDGTRRGPGPELFRPAADLMEFIGRPLLVSPNPESVEAIRPVGQRVVMNLKGSDEYAQWLEDASKHLGISKVEMFRLAMRLVAKHYKFRPPPEN